MKYSLPTLLALALLLVSCGDETMEEKLNRKLAEAVQEATGRAAEIDLDSVGKTLEGAFDSLDFNGFSDVEVLNFRDLKKLMPETAAGLARGKHIGETNKMLGIKFSKAEATYGSGDHRIEAEFIDSGGAGMLVSSMAGFTGFEVDKETEYGSERTLKLDGHPAYEKYSNRNGRMSSELNVLVNDRFIVSLDGNGVSAEALQETFRDFDLAALPVRKEAE